MVQGGDPEKEILKTVNTENIDLIIMLAHEEEHLEHFLFGRSNEEIIRKMPCSVIVDSPQQDRETGNCYVPRETTSS
jgi:universal stress protein A